jgi:hypothetical protein
MIMREVNESSRGSHQAGVSKDELARIRLNYALQARRTKLNLLSKERTLLMSGLYNSCSEAGGNYNVKKGGR